MNSITLDSMPYELKLYIMEAVYALSEEKHPRIMPANAAWAQPYYRFSEVGNDLRKAPKGANTQEKTKNTKSDFEWLHPLKALRLVSRQYNEICTRLLYQELNLDIIHLHTNTDLEAILQTIVVPYRSYVRSIRIHLGDTTPKWTWTRSIDILALIVSKCTNARTLAVYYKDSLVPHFWELTDVIVRMMEANQIIRFGLFSAQIMKTLRGKGRYFGLQASNAPMEMLKQILRSERACRALQRLDLTMEDMTRECLFLIRSRLTSLRSLTIRHAPRFRLPGIFEPICQQLWCQNNNLTTLNLMRCSSAHAAQMVSLVWHFPTLEVLVWATCGHQDDLIPPFSKAGWSKDPTSLPRLRQPLKLLVLEHALEWEIRVMGVIPAETVIVAHPDELRLTRSMAHRVEMFPGMKTLRVLPRESDEERESRRVDDSAHSLGDQVSDNKTLPTLDVLCEDLGVVLLRDAELLHPCDCC